MSTRRYGGSLHRRFPNRAQPAFYSPAMPLTTTKKQELINGHQTHGTDTGSVEVQVAMLSERVTQLTGHLQKNKHDFSGL